MKIWLSELLNPIHLARKSFLFQSNMKKFANMTPEELVQTCREYRAMNEYGFYLVLKSLPESQKKFLKEAENESGMIIGIETVFILFFLILYQLKIGYMLL